MREVVLSIPTLESEQNIEIEVKINGRKKTLTYCVELIAIDDAKSSTSEKIDVLRHVIQEHDKNWKLMQIGIPKGNTIPVMFRKRGNAPHPPSEA